ncbi:hypothetical protein [Enterobacter kobei]|uniref:hypothetical protein n=1 Tax=Enterobacter kobei TaxID=208224 RepID=UPI0028775305|nr:hypothetical protein [Enterobacter kobei]
MTPAELSEKLWDNAERVAKFLLPKGHLEGKEWCAGNTNGDSGKSLKVNRRPFLLRFARAVRRESFSSEPG